jgi:hypothetical protein
LLNFNVPSLKLGIKRLILWEFHHRGHWVTHRVTRI